ncbi:hypothetical protein P167DRAFT_533054 [Morchella conica CCBAS932]|uniref:Uncharacterized protein n=1 Tax=Morchella conica CCBAS932 TaxID=1392247 RepID=A0A3N4KYM1_9PEZI|nr:hypothetical protein P167DRAFT_533054 [Morchella conica CCBAS932]
MYLYNTVPVWFAKLIVGFFLGLGELLILFYLGRSMGSMTGMLKISVHGLFLDRE